MATVTSSRPTAAGQQPNELSSSAHSHPFTCVTCAIAFRSNELQKGHMRTDWHRYNLKRRVASLPPLPSEIFAEKVLSAQATSSAAAAKASFEKTCEPCQKTYFSENAFQNHLGSQKHRLRLTAVENGEGHRTDDETTSIISSTISLGEPLNPLSTERDPEAEVGFSQVINGMNEANLEDEEPMPSRPSRQQNSAEGNDLEHLLSATSSSSRTPVTGESSKTTGGISLRRCLFCNYESPSLKLSVSHMTKFHGMFIPEQPYLIDLEGLISHLQEKVIEDHVCLLCHKVKGSASGIQTHMRDKGHCMIAFDSEEDKIEVGQFYDFRSTYSDEEDEDTDAENEKNTSGGGVKLGSKRIAIHKTIITNENGGTEMLEGDENADGWETDSSASSLDSADLHAVPIDHDHAFSRLAKHRHHSHNDPRPHHTADGFHSHAHSHYAVFHSDHELHLPSGRIAGHRSLARYYRQNLHDYPSPQERAEQRLLAANAGDDSEDEGTDRSQTGRGRQIATRGNSGREIVGVADVQKREVVAVEKRERRRAQRAEKHYQWGVEKRGNMQKHFRDPLLQ